VSSECDTSIRQATGSTGAAVDVAVLAVALWAKAGVVGTTSTAASAAPTTVRITKSS
jgi:hypothetical protein